MTHGFVTQLRGELDRFTQERDQLMGAIESLERLLQLYQPEVNSKSATAHSGRSVGWDVKRARHRLQAPVRCPSCEDLTITDPCSSCHTKLPTALAG